MNLDWLNIGAGVKGWTVIDNRDNPTYCTVSVRTAVPGGQRPQVLACAELVQAPDADAGGALQALAGRVASKLPILCVLSRAQYRLQILPAPPVPAREMETSLRWTLNAANGSTDENNLAWFHLPADEVQSNRPQQLYVVETPKALLAELTTAWRVAGLRPRVVDIRETALRNIAGALERPGEGVALVAPDPGGVGMVFTYRGALYMDRYIEQPQAELRGADAATRARLLDRITQQVLRSIDVINRTFPSVPVGRVVVVASPEDGGLADHLAATLTQPVQTLDLNQLFDMSRVPELAASPALQARCLVALGAAMRTAKVAA